MANISSAQPPRAELLKSLVIESLEDGKAQDVVCLPLEGKSDIADYIVVATGTSSRHIHALATQLAGKIAESGLTHFATEGMAESRWVVVDNPYVLVHLFMPELRGAYNLEKMWSADFSDLEQAQTL